MPSCRDHPRRRRILRYIAREIDRHGYPPTIREIGAAVGISSTSLVNYHLLKLEDAGLIERSDAVSRGLSLTPAGYAALGLVSPAADAALGRALRLAAEAGDETAAAVVEALGVEVAA